MKKSLLGFMFVLFVFSIFAIPIWDNPTCVRKGVNIDWNEGCADTPDQNVIYVWSDISSGNRDIYAQKFSLQGQPIWVQPIVIDNRPGLQENPQIISAGYNHYVITWVDFSNNATGNIYAQAINQDGNILWQNNGVLITSSQSYKKNIQMVDGNSGTCFIIWADDRNNNYDIYGQCLNVSGNIQWTVDGRQLTFMPADEDSPIAVNDTSNGILIGYNYQYQGFQTAYLMRYSNQGAMVWGSPYQVQQNEEQVRIGQLIKFDNSSFIYTWRYYHLGTYYIATQRINRDMQTLWASPVVFVDNNIYTNPQSIQCVKTSDNKFIMTWESTIYDPYIQSIQSSKISSTGDLEWTSYNSIEAPINVNLVTYKIENNHAGGVFLMWETASYYENNATLISLQNISTDGAKLFGEEGLVVNDLPYANRSMNMRVVYNNLFLNWEEQRDGNSGIFTQIYDLSGNPQFPQNGIAVRTAIAENIEFDSIKLIQRSNDTMVLWEDQRSGKIELYFQIVDTNGDCLLATNGIRLTSGLSSGTNFYSAAIDENDNVIVVWDEFPANDQQVYGQLVDENGNKLWGDNGIRLSGTDSAWQSHPSVSYEDGAFYIGWTKQLDNIGLTSVVCGQKIVNGIPQWGDTGINISATDLLDYNSTSPILSGRFYVWTQNSNDGTQIMVKLVNPDGTTANGWNEVGQRVDDYAGPNIVEFNPAVNSDVNGVYLSWRDLRNDYISKLYAQHISTDGQSILDPSGLLVNVTDTQIFSQLLNDIGLLYLWDEWYLNPDVIHSAKYNFSGVSNWQDIPVISGINNGSYEKIIGAPFDDGSYLIAASRNVENEMQLKYTYIDANGNVIGASDGSMLNTPLTYISTPAIVPAHQNAYISWAEITFHKMAHGTEGGYPEDLKGLYIQKMNNEPVENNDPAIPSSSMSLEQNYPNPFNPETTIKYSLPARSDVTINIYNIKGQVVTTLVNESQASGVHSIKWNGKDDNDKQVASGVYFYRLDTGSKSITKKMVLLK